MVCREAKMAPGSLHSQSIGTSTIPRTPLAPGPALPQLDIDATKRGTGLMETKGKNRSSIPCPYRP